MDAYLSKPIQPLRLFQVVERTYSQNHAGVV
jgi:hypothetical protein